MDFNYFLPNFNMDFSTGFNYSAPEFSNLQNQNSIFSPWNNNFYFSAFQPFSIWNQSPCNSSTATQSKKTSATQEYKIGKFDLDFWKAKGYDHGKGKELALDASQIKRGTPGQCVGYTRKTINRVYGTHFTNAGAAQKFGTTILSQPELKNKFRKVDMKDVEKGGIPDGAVVLWKAGSPGFTKGKSALYGHGGICYQGKVYSNYVEERRLNTCFEVWIPVCA